MDETPRQKLARLMAGMLPYGGLKNDAGLPPFQKPGAGMEPFLPPIPAQRATMPAYQQPFTGLRNTPQQGLPAFEQPGGSLPIDRYMQPRPAPAPVPAPAPMAMQSSPMPEQQAGGQGWGGPEPAPGTIPEPYDAMTDPRYLPEQWRGAFNPRWQG